MKKSSILNKIRKTRNRYVEIFVGYTFDLSERIHFLLDQNNMDQKTLAKKLGKNESEVSKWLAGSHNFTLKTIARIEDILEAKLLEIPKEEKKLVEKEKFKMFYLPLSHNHKYFPETEIKEVDFYSIKSKKTNKIKAYLTYNEC
ncbi:MULTISPECIES: multiprotein-bridging factor 1 family protein [unclassified Tenacibaculum]|uniref:helix-turn-helix domain-containing protein n=1 Tax=unclassified Tenacibaculum TaxID=2635139 RepID=UPI001F1A08A2|nr:MULTISPECIES: helix-turn-helix transcriptional regulator [unclassified Tenacibaculum]MCF2875449.1 helix-turn-helix domain-containing protein [Tenacibaculum sp. Cn5-1]MCF2935525.1 helix-turn-helix domain-containing protein [Tenacibaculum sp. Cn5-34]MCG7512085.1 helix-turn-helix domain-containing protein [Tenacibaculum sp. Cn5-46]